MEQKTIEGITPNPHSTASALHNIKRVLEVLSKKNVIPLYYTYSAESIYEGDAEMILGLLKNIRHAYKTCQLVLKDARKEAETYQKNSGRGKNRSYMS